jgi:hypothetical protein
MKRTILILLGLFCLNVSAFAGVDFTSVGMKMAGQIVSNPAGFLYDFQQDLESTTPLPPGKSFGVQTGLWGGILPTIAAMPSISGKYRLHPEGRWAPGIPQLDLIGGYWSSPIAKSAASNSQTVDSMKFNGYYMGALVTSSVSPRVRTFWGYKHSVLNATLDFKSGKEPELLGTKVNSFDTGFSDDFLVAGIETPKGVGKLWSIQLNYGMKTQTFCSKVSWYGKVFELGLNIYPEGVLVVHPVWNMHLNF